MEILEAALACASGATPVKRLRPSIAPFDGDKIPVRAVHQAARGAQRIDRLLHAAENMVSADQFEQSEPRKALLRAHGFEPRDGDVDPPAAQPANEFGEHGCAGVVDLDQRVRLDHDQLRRRYDCRSARWRGENCRR